MTNPSDVSEQYIGHINRLCCAADIKNWTDSNCCYDIAESTVPWCRVLRVSYWGYGTVRWCRVLRERVTGVNWTDSNCCYDIADGTVPWCRVLRESYWG